MKRGTSTNRDAGLEVVDCEMSYQLDGYRFRSYLHSESQNTKQILFMHIVQANEHKESDVDDDIDSFICTEAAKLRELYH